MKIDTEGYELEVLEGAKQILQTFRPTVLLEMNHWCLNAFRRTSIPEFRDRLLQIFPFVYVVQSSSFHDFREEQHLHEIYYRHILKMDFSNIVAGFDIERTLRRLETLQTQKIYSREPRVQLAVSQPDREDLVQRLAQRDAEFEQLGAELASAQASLHQVLNSHSWKLTAPLRAVAQYMRGRK
jgi:hypothetical protein